jgi:hypothetical protein
MYRPVCILIMAHSHEALLMELLSRLQHPDVLVFVHIDKKSQSLFEKLSARPGTNLVQQRVDVRWAHISQVEATVESYRQIAQQGWYFDHFLVISGQDQPIQPVGNLVKFLSANKEYSFLNYAPLSKDGWDIRKRYQYPYYVPNEKLKRKLMTLTGIKRKFPLGLKPFGGSQWITMAEQHMGHILSFCDDHPELMQFMRTTKFPEEMLFQTLLFNSPFSNFCVNNDLRFVIWAGKSNPEILTEQYKTAIETANDKFFARKFDWQQSASLLAWLKEKVK